MSYLLLLHAGTLAHAHHEDVAVAAGIALACLAVAAVRALRARW